MIAHKAESTSSDLPALGPALAAMTGVQALVAIALFAPGVLAPKLGLGVGDVGLFSTMVFVVGMATSLYGGSLARSMGPCRVAAFCAIAITLGMALASLGGTGFLILAGVCVGLAFGPETPASSTLLSKLATPARQPLIFSIRQTGNQIGAIAGSLILPAIAITAPATGFWVIAGLGVGVAFVLAVMSRRYDAIARTDGQPLNLGASMSTVWRQPRLRALALVSMPFSAMQLGLNAFLVSFAVESLKLSHVRAGVLLAIAQAGGLVGRLFWGLVATKAIASRSLLIGLGAGMSIAAISMALLGSHLPFAGLAVVAFLFGLTASGWNGVFLAEVARLAPDGRVAEVTGAVLTASYAGLLLGPGIVTVAAIFGTLSLSYVMLALLTLIATFQLSRADNASP